MIKMVDLQLAPVGPINLAPPKRLAPLGESALPIFGGSKDEAGPSNKCLGGLKGKKKQSELINFDMSTYCFHFRWNTLTSIVA